MQIKLKKCLQVKIIIPTFVVNLKIYDMIKIYVIQDVKTKEYYWSESLSEGFNANISEARTFSTEDAALDEIIVQNDWTTRLFKERFLEIKCYYQTKD